MNSTKLFFLLLACSIKSLAQLSGTYTIPGSYASMALAINDLNTQGVSGSVTILVSAGHTETVGMGGLTLTASGSSTSPIVFQKSGSGANPQLIAYTGGTAVASSAIQDGIWRFIGCDYVTIDGIDLFDPNTSNPSTMEFGFAFFKANANDGCNNNTIKNCTITLNRINITNGAGPAFPGSRAIDVVNALSTAHTSSMAITSATGSNSNNKFYNNLIQNCNFGFALSGFIDVLPFSFADHGNDIGGLTAVTGNTIINYGGGTAFNNASAAVRTNYQHAFNASNNFIDNNNGSGVNGLYLTNGIHTENMQSGTNTILSNTISLKTGGFNAGSTGINLHGSGSQLLAVSASSNVIVNCSKTFTSGASFIGIFSNATPSVLNISSNTFTNITVNSPSGTFYSIYSLYGTSLTVLDNNLSSDIAMPNSSSGGLRNIYIFGGITNASVSISSNTLQAVTTASNAYLTFYMIDYSSVSSGSNSLTVSNNVMRNMTVTTNNTFHFIDDGYDGAFSQITGNKMLNVHRGLSGGTVFGINCTATSDPGSTIISGNTFSNVSTTDASALTLINVNRNNASHSITVSDNTLTSISSISSQYNGINVSGNSAFCALVRNHISGYSGSGPVYGLSTGVASSVPLSILENSVASFTTAGHSIYGISQNANTTVNFSRNKVYDFAANSSSTMVRGIHISQGSLVNMQNNIVGDLRAVTTVSSNAISGINVAGVTNLQLMYNTVRLSSTSTSSLFGSSALCVTAPTGTINYRNNIFINTSAFSGNATTAAFRDLGSVTYSNSSNNNIFYAGVPSANNLVYTSGSPTYSTLAAMKTLLNPRDANSFTENTPFISTSGSSSNFLHISPPSLAESNGVNIPGIASDFDNDVRQGNLGYVGTGTSPDIGADEFETPCSSIIPAAISPNSFSICVGQAVTFTRSAYPNIPNVTQQWQFSTTSGSSYTNMVGTASTIASPTLSAGNYYFINVSTCTLNNQTISSNEATVVVYPFPIVNVSPASTTFCPGGAPVTLSASGATSYTWSGSGLSSNSGATVNAQPSFTTTYIITGANPGGCTGTTSAIVQVKPSPGTITVSANPTLVCQGYTTNLQASATSSVYGVTPITYAPVTPPTSGVGTLCINGNIQTFMNNGNLNDGDWAVVPIPFSFKFFNNFYSGCSVSTNGFISLGSVNPITYNGYGIALPSSSAGRPSIGAVYSDLTFNSTGSITYYTSGVTPNRKFVVQWTGGRFNATNSGTVTTQIVLFESSHIIEVHTARNTAQVAAVEGIQDDFGNVAYVVSGRNNQIFNITNDAYRWSPALTYSWSPSTYLSSSTVTNPVVSGILNPTTYTVSAIAANGCIVSAVRTISVIAGPTVSATGPTSPICEGSAITLSASGASNFTWTGGAQGNTITATPIITTTYVATGTWTNNSCNGIAAHVVTVIPNPSLTIGGSTSICEGQTGTVTVSGADTYSWSTGSTNTLITLNPLNTTTVLVTGTSTLNNCFSVLVNTLTVYPNPTVAIVGSSSVCSGKNLTLTANGANTFSWSNGPTSQINIVQPNISGSYSVIGTNTLGACTSTAIHQFAVAQSPSLSVTSATSICAGQSAALTVSGANTYLWSTGSTSTLINVNPNFSSTYSVTGSTSNGCSSIRTIAVTVGQVPSVVISGTNALCAGQTIGLTASGANSYTWSNGSGIPFITITPSVSMAYSVTGASAQNCTNTTFIFVTVNPLPVVSFTALPSQTVCAGETATIIADAGGFSFYQWGDGSNNSSITIKPAISSNLTIQVRNGSNGCTTDTSFALSVDDCTNLSELQSGQLLIYPNPVSGTLMILVGQSDKFSINDLNGKTILTGILSMGNNSIDLSNHAKGVYTIQLDSNLHNKIKLVVE